MEMANVHMETETILYRLVVVLVHASTGSSGSATAKHSSDLKFAITFLA